MKINATIKWNITNLNKLSMAIQTSLLPTLEAMKTEVNSMQVVPKETGALEESVVVGVNDGKGFMSYNTPYARKLYYNPQFNFRRDKNQFAQGRWLDPFIYGDKQTWLVNTYSLFLINNSKGVIK